MSVYGKAFKVNQNNLPLRLLVAACVMIVSFVLADVAMVMSDHTDSAAYLMGLGLPAIFALLGVGHLSGVAHDTNAKVDKLMNGATGDQLREVIAEKVAPTLDRIEMALPDGEPAKPQVVIDARTPLPADSHTRGAQT